MGETSAPEKPMEASFHISPSLREQLLKALQAAPAQPGNKMTYEEFLAWADEDMLAEWVNGEIVMTSPASNQHQDIVGFLESLLRLYVEERQLGVIRTAPFQIKLENGREPDLLFVSNEHLSRLQKTHLEGPADMVVEVISEASQNRDRGDKFYEYEQAGIPEYWLIDPIRQWAEFYRLDEHGHYRPAVAGNEGVFHSGVVTGFWLRLEWLWQPPRVLLALKELQLIS
jgi:Uma2 family endonuclease